MINEPFDDEDTTCNISIVTISSDTLWLCDIIKRRIKDIKDAKLNYAKCFRAICNYIIKLNDCDYEQDSCIAIYNFNKKDIEINNIARIEIDYTTYKAYVDTLELYYYAYIEKCVSTENNKFYVHCDDTLRDVINRCNNIDLLMIEWHTTMLERKLNLCPIFKDNVHSIIKTQKILPYKICIMRYFYEKELADELYNIIKKHIASCKKKYDKLTALYLKISKANTIDMSECLDIL